LTLFSRAYQKYSAIVIRRNETVDNIFVTPFIVDIVVKQHNEYQM